MKGKLLSILLCTALCVGIMTGCTQSKESAEVEPEVVEETVAEETTEEVAEETEEVADVETTLPDACLTSSFHELDEKNIGITRFEFHENYFEIDGGFNILNQETYDYDGAVEPGSYTVKFDENTDFILCTDPETDEHVDAAEFAANVERLFDVPMGVSIVIENGVCTRISMYS